MKRTIPYVQQLEITDCGAACLAMTLQFHGKSVPLRELREHTGTSRDGVDALAIARAARRFGLRARGVRVEPEALKFLPPGSILHWEFDHFVVFERANGRDITVVDPALGRRVITREEFGKCFTGVAITLEPTESFEVERAGSKGTWRYLRNLLAQSHVITRIAVISLLIQMFALAVPIFTGVVVDRIVPQNDVSLLTILVSGLSVMIAFHMLASFVRGFLLVHLRTRLDIQVTLGFIDHLVDLPYFFFLQRSTGDLMARLNSNVTIREVLTSGALSSLLDGVMVSFYLILISVQSLPLGLLALGLGTVQIALLLLSRRRQQRLMSENLQAQAKAQGYLVQLLSGIESLKAAGAEPRAVDRFGNLFTEEMNVTLRRGKLNAAIESILGTLRVGSPLMMLAAGVALVLQGDLTLGQMLALSALAIGFLGPLSNLITVGMQVQLLASYMERINDVFDTPIEQPGVVRHPGRLTGGVRLESVSFRYAAHSPEVVRGVDLTISPGRRVAIVGRSGSGKSTLANLLLGLYTPTSGKVFYDGIDLFTLDLGAVRSRLGIVPQKTFLFGASIRDNIALTNPDLPLEAVEQAARIAGIDEDIERMPMRYETILADGGASLSGGQRQRIAIARAVVGDPVILVLDEATSELDALMEVQVHRNLDSLSCTRVIIAHRLSTIAGADLILVMRDGAIVERGDHASLVSLGGEYFRLVRAQAGFDASPAINRDSIG